MKSKWEVTVEAETFRDAVKVIAERLEPDEDYGFPYTITHRCLSTGEVVKPYAHPDEDFGPNEVPNDPAGWDAYPFVREYTGEV